MKLRRILVGHFEWLGVLGQTLGPKLRARGLRITCLSLFESALDVVSIGSVVPLLTLAANPDSAVARTIVASLETLTGPLRRDQALLLIAVAVALALTVRALVKLLAAWLKSAFFVDVRLQVARGLVALYSQEPYERQLRANPSRRLTLVTSDAANVGSLASDTIGVVGSGVNMLAMIMMMLWLHWPSTLVALVVGAVLSGASYLGLSRRLQALGTRTHSMRMSMATIAARMLQGFQENAIYDPHGSVRARFDDKAAQLGHSLRLSVMLRRLPVIVAEWVLAVSVIVGICVLTVVADFSAALPVAVAFAAAALRLGPAAVAAITDAALLRFHLGSLYDVHKDLCGAATGAALGRVAGSEPFGFTDTIVFEDVSFTYQRATAPALEHADARIEQGIMLAVCGPSGSGKSTFVNLLLGLLAPSAGAITVDGRSIRGRENEWQRRIALVPQDPFFWNASIRDNLLFGREFADAEERIWRALEIAQLAEFVRALPRGIETLIGERGALVSGGQRQRLAIARALIDHPEVLILDEPTSALDQEIAQAIDEALVNLKGRATVVLVAHRAASVAVCDRVLYFERGRLVATGTFDELGERHDGFARALGLPRHDRVPSREETPRFRSIP